MRTIEFRGFSVENKWVFGDLIQHRHPNLLFIEHRDETKKYLTPVKAETVGQYTGVKDRMGKKIYEFDIVRDRFGMTFVVVLDVFENRFVAIGFADEIWNERQGDCRFIRESSIEKFELVVLHTKFDDEEYQQTLKSYLDQNKQEGYL